MKKYFSQLIICLALLVINPVISKAEQIYDLNITTLQGQNFDLKKMHGKVVVVTFFTQWCPNCLKEMVDLEQFYSGYHQYGLEIIAVSLDPKKSLEKVKQRVAKVSYPSAMLEDAISSNFPEIHAIPTTYIFDKSGAMYKMIRSAGRLDKKMFEELLLSKST
jgi:cytochrome c biogenesis protein CcmG, thiol:disulfide interchange protein DsbE